MENKQSFIRNFCIIAHIDHGKSTLADRLLDMTKTIATNKITAQFLDSMELEKEKGITIKLKPVRMHYTHNGKEYILNLVDTPGHVDFAYEVSRSLAAVEGAVLLVDATQGIQAQTLANIDLAKKQNLVIIPVVNKIDMDAARVEESCQELAAVLGVAPESVIKISAKNGLNVEQVLQAVVEKIPSPEVRNAGAEQKPFRALIFDSTYDSFKGVLALVRVIDGSIKDREKIELLAAKTVAEVKELGYLAPGIVPQPEIFTGEIGYIATGIKEPGKVRVGDTIVRLAPRPYTLDPLPGYSEPNPMVFASFYPEDPEEFEVLKVALGKLKLQDPALVYEAEMKEALGRGFRCGFLGTLHVEIISERLEREFNLGLVISTPSVIYKLFNKKGQEQVIYSASDWPDPSAIEKMEEPWVLLEIIAPASYVGKLMDVLNGVGGNYLETNYLSAERAIIKYEAPLRAIVANLYDKIKSTSQGYASLNYTMLGYRPAVLVKMEIWIAGRPEEAFSRIVEEHDAHEQGKKLVEKLKEALPQQQFTVALQAVIGGKVIARETISARRKDVTGYLYGGDKSRKKKLLEKQKKGKALMKDKGKVTVPSKTFLEIFRA
ncbi:MAG: elongation factor 4 [Candidatus Staskawiczbacteria bacterium RIFCSPHIGHO2_02_FULL_43_16]|uniref:Elongation factor 4 n=1 Tax=Candidatus Staskawiczbacteria bacterium RIFCSPHIGHO2_01_FULL_41_41 TaxID=1802203 RepID=A0A1G2HS15_9BACT|nr:MAG: elongation factor 4 [Candidatus Staskawiczbacteria bacterium RIFCSPHIGHO2_01_FULL_41_41]OGZ69046.1 MAG: elongation factor 4 [Candidatus Staskawiczbacteria bacterium RIFCSPHIGHO2_02_FULL_43_16]OGZ74526.1 MAG: elongation factor 4 [Candidatus Staskawiczbacteria bacterium RIFCSPLOWO2_01_FULL_43_17b]